MLKKSHRQQIGLLLLTGIFLMLSAPALFAQVSWYEQGKNAKDNNQKVDFFTRSIENDRQDKWVYYLRAWAYYDLQKYEKSIRDFNKAIEAEGDISDSHLHAGISWSHYQLDEYQTGLNFANLAIEKMESNAEAWNVKGWCQIGLKVPKKAIVSFTKYISLSPKLALGYSNRSYAYLKTQQFQKTIDDCNQALAINPENEFLLERKAYSMMKLGKKDEAIKLIESRIQYQPNEPMSMSSIGNLFYRNEDYATAIQYHSSAIRLYHTKIRQDKDYRKTFRDKIYEIYMSRGESHYALKDYQRALADFKKATEINPELYRAWYEIGQLQTYQKNWSEGAQAYEKAFQLRPDLKGGWVNLGFCYDKLHRPDRAISAYSRGIKNNPEDGLLYNNRGYGYLELKKYEEALADLKKAIEVDPEIVMSHVSLGEYYYDVKEYGKAIVIFDKALLMEDGSDQAYTAGLYTRGMCHFSKENHKLAKADFIAAIAITPKDVRAHEKLGISQYHLKEYCDAYTTLKKTLDLEKMVPYQRKKAKEAPLFLGKMTRNPCL